MLTVFCNYYCLIVFYSCNLFTVLNARCNNHLFFSELLVCIFKSFGSVQNGSLVGNKHLSPFQSQSIFFRVLRSTTVINFICNTTFDDFLIAFKIFRLSSYNFCFPSFPSNLNGVLYRSSIAPRMICGVIF